MRLILLLSLYAPLLLGVEPIDCLPVAYALTQNGPAKTTVRHLMVTPDNSALVFNYEYTQGTYGAKAFTYRDSKGKVNHMFWSQCATCSGQFQHFEALAHLMRADVDRIQQEIEHKKEIAAFYGERGKALIHEKKFQDAGKLYTKKHEILTIEIPDLEAKIRAMTALPFSLLRGKISESFRNEYAEKMFGYELAAVKDDKIPGGYRITTFRIDSMVTRIQEKLWEYSVPDDAQLAFAAYVADIHNSIDPRLRDYDNKIDLPDGLYRSLKPPSMFTAELKKYGLSLRD